jgi:AmiR/NasT family two-component response regulator
MTDTPCPVADLEADVELADLRAAQSAMVYQHAREGEQWNEALASRTVIGKAIGLLMSEYNLNEDAAFEALVRRSSLANVKLRDIAQQAVDAANAAGGALPPDVHY